MIYNHLPVEELISMKTTLENKIAWENRPVMYPPPGYKVNHGLVREYHEQIEQIDRAIQGKNRRLA